MASLAEQLLLRAAVTGTSPPPDQVVREKCPLLWGLLTQDFYRDGTIRVLPTLKVERTVGAYLVILQDHASHQQVSCEVTQLADLAKALEAVLRQGGDAFRPYKSQKVKDISKRVKPKNP